MAMSFNAAVLAGGASKASGNLGLSSNQNNSQGEQTTSLLSSGMGDTYSFSNSTIAMDAETAGAIAMYAETAGSIAMDAETAGTIAMGAETAGSVAFDFGGDFSSSDSSDSGFVC